MASVSSPKVHWYPPFESKKQFQAWSQQQAATCDADEWHVELIDSEQPKVYVLTEGRHWYRGKGHDFWDRRRRHMLGTKANGAKTTQRYAANTTDPVRVLWYTVCITGFQSKHQALAFESRLKHSKLQRGMRFDERWLVGIVQSCRYVQRHHDLVKTLYKACTLNRFSPKLPDMYIDGNTPPLLTLHWFEPMYRGGSSNSAHANALPPHVRERNVSEREKRAIYAQRYEPRVPTTSIKEEEEEEEEAVDNAPDAKRARR
jgi:predicted GIY-YIG superfamily endonuclease